MEDKYYDVAIIVHSLKVGGSEKFTLSIANRFSERGFNVLLILLEFENPLLSKLNARVDFIVLSRKFKYDISISYQISKILSGNNINKVLCIEPYSFFLTKIGELFVRKKRMIYLSLHHSKPTKWKKRILDIIFLKFSSHDDLVFFICQYQKTCFSDLYLFSPSSSFVIYNGIDTEYFSPDRTIKEISTCKLNWRLRLGISEIEPVIVLIGRISPEKGHKYAIEALHHLCQLLSVKAHLLFIGNGSDTLKKQLLQLADNINLGQQIHFEGTQFDVRPYLLSADLFVLTSISETFSLAALEAMSMGMPCSLTNVGGARELIVDNKLGDLCTPGDVLSIAGSWAKVLSRKNDRASIREWVLKYYGEQQMISKYIDTIGLNYRLSECKETI